MAGYEELTFKVKGVAPLLMHNGALRNPRDPYTKLIAPILSKRNKTEADYAKIADLELVGGLYTDDETRRVPLKGAIVVPEVNIEATLCAAARKKNRGKQAIIGLIVPETPKLIYDGPKTPNGLLKDKRFQDYKPVIIKRNSIMRMRPIFRDWALEFKLMWETSVMKGEDEVREFVEIAGREIGFCDWRPKHGRFEVVNGA